MSLPRRTMLALACVLAPAAACSLRGGTNGPTVAEATHPLVGHSAPPLAGKPALDGEGRNLLRPGATVNKPFVVHFWAVWSEPCRTSLPRLQAMYAKYNGQVELVAVAVDDEPSRIEEVATTYDLAYPIVWDDGRRLVGKWRASEMPSTFVVDRAGFVRFVHLGYHDGLEAEIEKELATLLPAPRDVLSR